MGYVTSFINNINSRNIHKASCTKSGLIPMKALNICVNLMRFLKIYNFVYTISLVLFNISKRKKLLKFYSQFVKKDDLCFDIGANLGSRTEVFLIQKAVSNNVGEEDLMISNSHTVSSMSKKWIDSLKSSDMFFISTSAFQWQKSVKVTVTTLDHLIKEFGRPAFCKIDVEGYEYKVLKGLSKSVGVISFEFTPTQEFIYEAVDTIKHLANIGEVEFNYSLGASMELAIEKWIGPEEISNILLKLLQKTSFCGDIYAKFI